MEELKYTCQLLVVNAGSSSLKVSLFEYDEKKSKLLRLGDAAVSGIGSNAPTWHIEGSDSKDLPLPASDKCPLEPLLEVAKNSGAFPIDYKSLVAVGHRIVHGGERVRSEKVTPELLKGLTELSPLAPLHNPFGIEAIKIAMSIFNGDIPHVAVFDTAFHSTMPLKAKTYGIPFELAERYHIRRYGFHGIAHHSLWKTYKNELSIESRKSHQKVISLQLGAGCSLAAIKDGVSLDTTMGFTPGEGVLMATRAGDVDSEVIPFLCSHEKKSAEEIVVLLNQESGLLGVSGASSDMRTLISAYDKDSRASLAVDLFVYRVIKAIGSYTAILGGVDALLFSGGIGENSEFIRREVCKGLAWYGCAIDDAANKKAKNLKPSEVHVVSRESSAIKIMVIGGNENEFIAHEVIDICL
jgi:acetate kinase